MDSVDCTARGVAYNHGLSGRRLSASSLWSISSHSRSNGIRDDDHHFSQGEPCAAISTLRSSLLFNPTKSRLTHSTRFPSLAPAFPENFQNSLDGWIVDLVILGGPEIKLASTIALESRVASDLGHGEIRRNCADVAVCFVSIRLKAAIVEQLGMSSCSVASRQTLTPVGYFRGLFGDAGC